jgi:hypothetical protein
VTLKSVGAVSSPRKQSPRAVSNVRGFNPSLNRRSFSRARRLLRHAILRELCTGAGRVGSSRML